MRKKLGITFVAGIIVIITGFALIGSYEGSGNAWPLPVPGLYEFLLNVGSVICVVSGVLLANVEKITK